LANGPAHDPQYCGGLQYFRLDLPRPQLEALSAVLTPEERERAARFHAAQHRDRFIAAHGLLRQLLGDLLNLSPAALRFTQQEHGKPRLAADAAQSGLTFNLSHSGSCALLGWSWRGDIGVDIELWRTLSDEAALVRRFFSAAENAAYEALPPAQRRRGFFECWTRKEAYIKAVGHGLALPLHSFDVSLGEGVPARLLKSSAAVDDARSWSLAAVELGSGASGAVVLEGDTCRLTPAVEAAAQKTHGAVNLNQVPAGPISS
jgi:4'-phosphopantetheinyl transferase